MQSTKPQALTRECVGMRVIRTDTNMEWRHLDDRTICKTPAVSNIVQIMPADAGLRAVYAKYQSEPAVFTVDLIAWALAHDCTGFGSVVGIVLEEGGAVPAHLNVAFLGIIRADEDPAQYMDDAAAFSREQFQAAS